MDRTKKHRTIVLYRAGDSTGSSLGQYFASKPPESIAKVRIDTAVKEQWINLQTGELEGTSIIDCVYTIKIPKGTVCYVGPTGYQGGIYLGGSEQIFIKEPWLLKDIEVVDVTPLE